MQMDVSIFSTGITGASVTPEKRIPKKRKGTLNHLQHRQQKGSNSNQDKTLYR